MVCNFEYNPQYYDFCCDKRNIFCWFLFLFYVVVFVLLLLYIIVILLCNIKYTYIIHIRKKTWSIGAIKYLYFKKQASGHKCNIYQTVLETMLLLLLFYYTICVKKKSCAMCYLIVIIFFLLLKKPAIWFVVPCYIYYHCTIEI